ncbi:MAG: NAD(P)-dependent oxidoreductase [Lachnospiraceae bacterium]|nr:NAD(P)-dependent oxidoreductase [Lachnospiraceae bacterium]
MRKILVTGASGYIGRHVVEQLVKDNVEVIAVDINLGNLPENVEKREISVFSGEKDIYKKMGSPDVCIHLAWQDGFRHNSHEHLGNLSKHYEFIKNMLQGGLKHIAVMGTMHEIGYWEGVVNEDTPTNPMSYYGIAKNCLRQATECLSKEFGAVYQWIRAFYITGDDMQNHSIFTKLIEMEKAGEKEFPFTTGKNKYDFLDIHELAFQIASVIEQEEITGIINCCSGVPISLGERVERFITENKMSIKLKYGAFQERKYDSPAIWGDDNKIREIITRKKYGEDDENCKKN